jgi:DNA-directed RNA polymerase subunit beta'
MGRLIPAGTGLEYYRRARIAGEDIVDTVEQEPENPMDALSVFDDDAKSLLAGGLDEDEPSAMGDVE